MSGNKMLAGAMEAVLFSQDPEYWALKKHVDALEKISLSGRVSVQMASGSRANFMWGSHDDDPAKSAGIPVKEA